MIASSHDPSRILADTLKDLESFEQDLARMLSGPSRGNLLVSFDDDDDDDSPELLAVTHRIAEQYIDVVVMVAQRVLSSTDHAGATLQLGGALDSLIVLADAAGDQAQVALLQEMRDECRVYEETGNKGRRRFVPRLRAWLPRYADQVGGDAGARLRDVFQFRSSDVPLFRELANLKGMGPKRLESLYCAGLHTVDALCAADAEGVSQVTGIPRALAEDLLAHARAWASENHRRTLMEMRDRLSDFIRVMRGLDVKASPELAEVASQAVEQMRMVVQSWKREEVR